MSFGNPVTDNGGVLNVAEKKYYSLRSKLAEKHVSAQRIQWHLSASKMGNCVDYLAKSQKNETYTIGMEKL